MAGVTFLAVSLTVSTLSVAGAAVSCLEPPTLDAAALVYDGKCPGDRGFPTYLDAAGKDVDVRLPADRDCTKRLWISNAGNVWIHGGTFDYQGTHATVIRVMNSSGITFVEGLHIDVNAKSPTRNSL